LNIIDRNESNLEIMNFKAMNEEHVSISAIGAHLDELVNSEGGTTVGVHHSSAPVGTENVAPKAPPSGSELPIEDLMRSGQ
jgi:hypothetical protein